MKPETLAKILAAILITALLILLIYWFFFLRRGPSIVERGPKDVGPIRFLFAVYGPGVQPTPLFSRPHGVASDRFGNMYVTDYENNRVCVFDANGGYLFQFGSFGQAKPAPGAKATWRPGTFYFPYGIEIDDSNGDIYVADSGNDRIQVFDSRGRFVRWFPQNPKGRTAIETPRELDVFGDEVFVAVRGRIAVFNRRGKYLRSIGSLGRRPNQMDGPDGVVVAPDGKTIYVSDMLLNRLQAFTPKGKLKWVRGEPPKGVTERTRVFGLPAGIDLDTKGNVYVVDAFHFSLQVYSPTGKKLAEVGSRGVAPAQFNFARGLALTPGDVLYVVDMENNRVQALEITKFVIQTE